MLQNTQLLSFAQRFGTPLFVYDGDAILERYHALFDFIPYPKLQVHYALKANFNPGILRLLQQAGCGIDAVSPGDAACALRMGFDPQKIIFTANNMTEAECDRMLDTPILMNVGSLSRLKKIAQRHPGTRLCLRFNPDVKDGDNEKTMTGGDLTKFGILLEQADQAAQIAREGKLRIVGLHEHAGSGLQHVESVLKSMSNLMAIATPERFPELEFLDFGGGFKVPYKPGEARVDYADMGAQITDLFQHFCKSYGKELAMKFEPGKYMVAEAGHLLMEANTIKHNRTRTIVGCNSGFSQLIRPVLYNAYHEIRNLSNPAGVPQLYDVCGNICETGDRFAEQRSLPEIREYDILSVENAGAYCYSMGSVYNLRAMPGEIVVQGGNVVSLHSAESEDALLDRVLREAPLD